MIEVENTISLLIADNQQEKQHQNRQRERKNGQKNRNNGGKKFRNECSKHGGHEWDECYDNPKNKNRNNRSNWRGRSRERRHENNRNERSSRDKSPNNSPRRSTSHDSNHTNDHWPTEKLELNSTKNNKIIGDIGAEVLVRIGQVTLRGLVDSGSSGTLMDKDIASKYMDNERKDGSKWATATGSFVTKLKADIKGMTLPQFSVRKTFDATVHLFKKDKSRYDIVIGRDLLASIGMILDYKKKEFRWDEVTIAMQPPGYWNEVRTNEFLELEKEDDGEEFNELTLLDSKYEKANLEQVAKDQTHLTPEQQQKLLKVLKKHEAMLQGKKGTWTGEPVDVKLKPNATPFHGRPYRVPHSVLPTLKKEIERLESIGVLRKVTDGKSEWAAPTFAIPKKDGRIRVVTDFRQLNKRLQRRKFPTPRMDDMLSDIHEFKYATCLDQNMGYYAMMLTENARKILRIVLPWGVYEYLVLPMGMLESSDTYQGRIAPLFNDMNQVKVIIDDMIILGFGTFEDHLNDVDECLRRLEENGMQINPLKCLWIQPEVDFLGVTITRQGVKPQLKKIRKIIAIKPPTNKRELRHFIGLINFY